MSAGRTFLGYRRANGQVGCRNHVVILPVDDISNAAAESVAKVVQGTMALPHPYGRLQFGPDLALHFQTLIGTGANPNVAAVVVIGIEPNWTRRVAEGIAATGKPVAKDLVSKVYVEPVDALFRMGRTGYGNVSRHKYGRSRVMTMRASAYDPSPRTIPGTTGRTAMGLRAGYGHVAVDPRVIRLGTMVFVEGYGFAIASDTGGAIKGNRIDLCFNTRSEALRFGRRTVRVHVLSKT